jgi:hypothetical protein
VHKIPAIFQGALQRFLEVLHFKRGSDLPAYHFTDFNPVNRTGIIGVEDFKDSFSGEEYLPMQFSVDILPGSKTTPSRKKATDRSK